MRRSFRRGRAGRRPIRRGRRRYGASPRRRRSTTRPLRVGYRF